MLLLCVPIGIIKCCRNLYLAVAPQQYNLLCYHKYSESDAVSHMEVLKQSHKFTKLT